MKYQKVESYDVPMFQDIRIMLRANPERVIARVSFRLGEGTYQHDVDITGTALVPPLRNLAIQAVRDGALAAGYEEVA